MPVRNTEQFVAAAIQSIQRQTFRDFELIVVDDGSEDGTARVVEELARDDDRIRLIRQAASGLIPTLVAAQQLARGKYIARMDGDDISYPDRFQYQLDYLDANENVVVVGGQVHIIDQVNSILRIGRYPLTPEECRRYLDFGPPFSHPATMILKSAFDQVDGYRSWFERAEDYVLWLRLAKIGDLANLDKVVLKQRLHAGNTSILNADANAGAVAMALTESHYGSDAIADAVILPKGTHWTKREPLIQDCHRAFARTAYLRALTLNGGIAVYPNGCDLLLNSISVIRNTPHARCSNVMLSFILSRAIMQFVRKGKFLSAGKVLAAALWNAPIETLQEAVRALVKRKLI